MQGDPVMDSAIVRTLILNAKLTEKPGGLQLNDIVEAVISLAIKKKLLSRRPRFQAEKNLQDKICEVIWGLILEGVYTPGVSLQTPNLPYLRATEYGRKCFQAGDVTPHDPDQYLDRLKSQSPGIDDVTLM